MAVLNIRQQYIDFPEVYTGLSTDVKPTLDDFRRVGSLFYETDTLNVYTWNGASWVLTTTSGVMAVGDHALDVSLGRISTESSLNKFGGAIDVDSGVATDVWDGADGATSTDVWVPPTAARLHDITSTSANDTNTAGTGARKVEIQGLDANWDLQTETVNLNGVANVATANTYLRIFRMQVTEVGSGGSNAGIITATAQTDATVTAAIQIGNNQTLMAIYTVPAGKVLLITKYYYGFLGNTPSTTTGNVRLLVADTQVVGTPFQLKHILPAKGGNPPTEHEFNPYFVVSEKHDIKMHMNDCDSNNSTLYAGFDGYLVDI